MAQDRMGRVFVEFAANTDPLIKSITEIARSMVDFEAKQSAAANRAVRSIDNAVNSADTFAKKMAQGIKAGFEPLELAATYSPQLQKFADQAAKSGQAMDPLLANLKKLDDAAKSSIKNTTDFGQVFQDFATNPLQAAKTAFAGLLEYMGPTAVGIGAVGTAAVTAAWGIGLLAEKLSDQMIALRNQSAATGLSVTQLQGLQRIGVETGVGLDSLSRMVGMLNRQLATGTKADFVKVLNAMREAEGKLAVDTSQGVLPVLIELDKRFAAMPEGMQKAELMNAAFNRRLQELGILLIATKGHFEEYMAAVEKTTAYAPQTQEGLARMHDQLSAIGQAWEHFKVKMVDAWVYLHEHSWVIPTIAKWVGYAPTAPAAGPSPQQALPMPNAAIQGVDYNVARQTAGILEQQKEMVTLAKIIASGTTANIELQKQLARAKEDMAEAESFGAYIEMMAAAKRVKAINDQIEGLKGLAEWMAQIRALATDAFEGFGVSQDVLIQMSEVQKRIDSIKQVIGGTTVMGEPSPEMLRYFDDELDKSFKMLSSLAEQERFLTSIAMKVAAITSLEDAGLAALGRSKEQRAEILRITKETVDALNKIASANAAAAKTQQEINAKGMTAGYVPQAVYDRSLREANAFEIAALHAYQQAEAQLARDVTQSKLEQLRLEQQIVGTMNPFTQGQRDFFDAEKVHLQFAIRAEEMRLRFEQMRAELMRKLTNVPVTNPLYAMTMADMTVLELNYRKSLEDLGRLQMAEITSINQRTTRQLISIWDQCMSSISDAWESGFYDMATGAKSFADGFKSIFADMGRAIVRALLDTMFNPVRKMLSQMLGELLNAVGWTVRSISSAFQQISLEEAELLGAIPMGGMGAAGGGAGGAGMFGIAGGLTAGGALATGGLMASVMALQAKNPYIKGAGAVGMYGTGMALAISAYTGMPLMSSLGIMFTNPATAILAGAIIGGIAIYKHLKDPLNLAAKEASRDLGIVMTKTTMDQFTAGLGFTNKDQWKGIRKDLEMSPLFIQQIALPAAQAAGTVDLLAQKLSAVTTGWGTFDFSAAFNLGRTTGDWSAFNAQFEQVFETSEALNAAMPDWKTKLEIPASVAEGWTMTAAAMKLAWDTYYESAMKAASVGDDFNAFLIGNRQHLQELVSIYPQLAGQMKQIDFLALFTQFEKTGRISEEFGAAIVAAGGDIQKFQDLADIAKINADFQEMVDVFNQTGEILPGLRDLFVKFGGDLKALDDAAELPNLKASIASIADFVSGLNALQPELGPLERIMSGTGFGANTWTQLAALGIDPTKMIPVADLISFIKGWPDAIKSFQETGKLPSLMEQAIWKFGGAAGTQALANYGAGFNTITPSLLAATESGMNAAYAAERPNVISYLKTVTQPIQDKIDTLTTAVTDEFATVGLNISAAVMTAQAAVSADLAKIMQYLGSINDAIGGAAVVAAAAPAVAAPSKTNTSPLSVRHELVAPAAAESQSVSSGNEAAPGYTIIINGDVFGYDDFRARVNQAVKSEYYRGGMAYLPA